MNYTLEELRGLSFHYDFWKSENPQTQAELLGQTSPFFFQAPFMSWEEQFSGFQEGSIEVEV